MEFGKSISPFHWFTGVNIFPFAPRYLGAEFYRINDLGQDFGGLNNKTFYKGFETTINRDIYLITFTKACNFVFNCCKIQEISMKIGLFTHYCTLPFLCWEESWFFGAKFISLGAEIVFYNPEIWMSKRLNVTNS